MLDNIWSYIQKNPFVIAEAGVNHLCSFVLANRLIKGAKQAGANAIKFQSYKAKDLCVKNAPRFWDWDGEVEKGGSQFDSYSLLDGFGKKEYSKLKDMCEKVDIEFMSTPFDHDAVDYLDELGVRIYKIASCDITNFPLIEHIAEKQKIVMLSTGASNLDEISEAVELIAKHTEKIVVMHCNLKYPTGNDEINLGMISTIKARFGKYVIGLSDHTIGTLTPAFAYMLGATVSEKHFTVDKTLDKSADHWLSADVSDMTEIVKNVIIAHEMIGSGEKVCTESELKSRKYARRSIVANRDIENGELFTEENLACKRPGLGLSPKLYKYVIGMKSIRNIKEDEFLSVHDLEVDNG